MAVFRLILCHVTPNSEHENIYRTLRRVMSANVTGKRHCPSRNWEHVITKDATSFFDSQIAISLVIVGNASELICDTLLSGISRENKERISVFYLDSFLRSKSHGNL